MQKQEKVIKSESSKGDSDCLLRNITKSNVGGGGGNADRDLSRTTRVEGRPSRHQPGSLHLPS